MTIHRGTGKGKTINISIENITELGNLFGRLVVTLNPFAWKKIKIPQMKSADMQIY